jgi:hypothetical protein
MVTEDTDEEKSFRARYADELKKKKDDARDTELENERNKVKQQGMRTPGRRGEQIKYEEIDKEVVRRYTLKKDKKQADDAKNKS